MARARRTRRSVASRPGMADDLPLHSTAKRVQNAAAEVAPQVGTIAIAAAATALVEAELLPAVLIGAGAAMAPTLLRGVGYVIRPLARTVIQAGYGTYRSAAELASEATEQVQDFIAEAR